MRVLSLFDGMACGMIAMQLAGVEVDSYDAYEVDKYAIKTAQHNFSIINEHGNVFAEDFTKYAGKIDFLVGGSPCTYWSIAQTKNRETLASGMGWELFSQYVRALHEAKPKYFIYENNKSMSKDIRNSIDTAFGFEAVLINSALVSAQNRQRLYWVGKRNADGTYSKVNVEQPEDRGILLKDVLDISMMLSTEPINEAVGGKSYCVTSRYYKGFGDNPGRCLEKHRDSMVAEHIALSEREMDYMVRDHQDRRWTFCSMPAEKEKSPCITANIHKGVPYNVVAEPVCVAERGRMYRGEPQHYEAREDGKTNTLTSVEKDNRVAEPITDIFQVGAMPMPNGELSTSAGFRIYSTEAKGRYLCANGGGAGAKTGLYAIPYAIEFDENGKPTKAIDKDGKEITIYEVRDGKITIKGNQYPIKLRDGYYIIRKLTVSECKRLQTVPEWYDFSCVSNSQAYKMLGNGWTCEVIAHLIRSCLENK